MPAVPATTSPHATPQYNPSAAVGTVTEYHTHEEAPANVSDAVKGTEGSRLASLPDQQGERATSASSEHLVAGLSRVGVGGGGEGVGFGLPCVVKVLGFLCSQLLRRGGGGGGRSVSAAGIAGSGSGGGGRPGGAGSTPTPRKLLCLRLMKTAVAAAGPALALYPPLLDMVQDDLCFALLQLVQGR